MKTGECYFRDENGDLYVAESFEENGEVITKTMLIEKAEIQTVEGE